MIIGLQIIAILFSLSMVYFAVLAFKRGELGRIEIYSWLALWICAVIFTVFPGLLRQFSMTFLVTRVFDLMVIGGFILSFTLVGSSYLRSRRLEKKIEDMIRKDALKNAKKNK